MKRIQNKVTFLLLPFLVLPTIVNADIPKPSQCPSVEAISRTEFAEARPDDNSPRLWGVYQYDHSYGTNWHSNFRIRVIANNKNQAFKKAREELAVLDSPIGPDNDASAWYCKYPNKAGRYEALIYAQHSPD